MKITPKIDVQETGATCTVLNLPTKEVKMKIDMQMESTDPKAQEKPEHVDDGHVETRGLRLRFRATARFGIFT